MNDIYDYTWYIYDIYDIYVIYVKINIDDI